MTDRPNIQPFTEDAAMTNPGAQAMLEPCPFCGGSATMEQTDSNRWSVGCDNGDEPTCMGYQSLTTFSRRSEAIEAWNKRASAVQGEPVAWREAVDTAEKELIAEYHSGRLNGNIRIRDTFKRLREALAHPAIGTPDNARVREALERAMPYVRPSHGGDIQADADLRFIHEALAALPPEQDGAKTIREALISAKCTSPDGTYVQASMDEVLAAVVHSRDYRTGIDVGTPAK